jgi:hypothetical protein
MDSIEVNRRPLGGGTTVLPIPVKELDELAARGPLHGIFRDE